MMNDKLEIKNGPDQMQGHWHSFHPSSKMITYGYTWAGKDATNKEAKENLCLYAYTTKRPSTTRTN